MSYYTYSYLEDGDATSATNISAMFTAVKTVIDDIDVEQLAPGAFGVHHGGAVYFTSQAGSLTVEGDGGTHIYTRAVFGASLQYRSASDWVANDGTDDTASIGTGRWTVVGHEDQTGTYTGDPALIVFSVTNPTVTAIKIGNSYASRCAGILLSANCNVHKLDTPTSCDVGFTFQFRVYDDTTWYTIKRSTRFVSLDDKVMTGETPATGQPRIDVPLRCLLVEADITAAKGSSDHGVQEVRFMTSVVDNIADAAELTLGHFNFSAIPLRAYI
jgi:hypothetical protein